MPLIVIDGTDGSGKATQTALLTAKLRAAGYPVFKISFPQYGQPSAGLIEEYLNGRYGSARQVGPYRASIFYACDRYAAGFKIRRALAADKIVVADRYTTANSAHQGGKITDPQERQKFFAWLEQLEFKIFNLPRPDLNIILHLPAAYAQKLIDKKQHRGYTDKKRDLHEADLRHLQQAEKIYLELADRLPRTKLINCLDSAGKLMSRDKIAGLIFTEVQKKLTLKLWKS